MQTGLALSLWQRGPSVQVLRNEATGFAADLWALGCLLYRMLLGSTPFAAASEYLIFERITSHDLQIPGITAPAAQDLIMQLLDSDPSRRIGASRVARADAPDRAIMGDKIMKESDKPICTGPKMIYVFLGCLQGHEAGVF